MNVRVESNDSWNCAPNGSCDVKDYPYHGVSTEGFEYLRFDPGAIPILLPMRFSGHYYDEETDLFENWHRYYDPSTGRYLQPEPLMASPEYVAAMAASGIQIGPYSYAANNPITFVDPNGREVVYPENPTRRFQRALNEVRQSPFGRAVLEDLEKSKTRFFLKEGRLPWDRGEPVGGQCGGAGHQRTRNGVPEVDIVINFAGIDSYNRLYGNAWTDEGTLGHELGHGLDFTDGFPARLGPPDDPLNERFADWIGDLIDRGPL